MKRLIAISFILLSVSAGRAEEIPLDQIWGYNLPGTRDIEGIPLPETDQKQDVGQTYARLRRERDGNIEQIRRALAAKPPTERALPGFVVPREPDFYILRAVSGQMVGDTRSRTRDGRSKNSFPVGDYITLVFYSHPTSYYVRLKEVKREDNEIIVRYQFEPHATPEVTVHFALIPLGKLPAGEYHVHFEQIPMDQKYREVGFEPVHPEALESVCRSFSFTIFEPPSAENALPAKDVTLIPLNRIWAYNMPGTRKVGELDAMRKPTGVTEHPIVNQIHRILSSWRPEEGETAGPAFLVVGTGKEALENAQAVFTKAVEPTKAIPRDTDLSLVFFSYIGGRYVRIVSAEKSDQGINVKYQFVTHTTAESTVHFALIPIGKLSREKFDVKITELPSVDSRGRPVTPIANLDRIVCQGTSFRVQKGD